LEASLEDMLKWVESPNVHETPILANPFGPPRYAQKTITERIEPFATGYDELWHTHPDYWACPGCGGQPDPKFYAPTPELLALDAALDELRAKGFREAPNPDYDAGRAAEWKRKRGPFNQQKVTWGMSSLD
jgi:rubredoxin